MARVLSALVLIPFLVALVWLAPQTFFMWVLIALLAIAAHELHRLLPTGVLRRLIIVPYLVLPFVLIINLRMEFGPPALMMLAVVIIVSDSAQYYSGRAFGRRKLAPTISPKKTVEGAIGGLVMAALAAVVLGRIWPIGLSDLLMAFTGLVIAIAGMAGDLFESALKRRAGVKDSGNLIPGHGGILDRIDSWLFAAPVFWLILRFGEVAP